jgi:outer membrane immunogenic protein
MRKTAFCIVALTSLIATSAIAADMAVKAPPPPIAPAATWTGCYVGVEGGGNWGQTHSIAAAGPNIGDAHSPSHDLSGGLAGGTVGCNYQIATNWLVGAEGDFSWTNQSGSAMTPPPFNTTVTITETERWFGTARGRIGYVANNWLVYATGGAAWTKLNLLEGNATFSESENRVLSGGTVGGGVEWRFAPQWSAKAEYLYVAYTPVQYFGIACCTLENRHLTDNIFRVGVDYAFATWPGK